MDEADACYDVIYVGVGDRWYMGNKRVAYFGIWGSIGASGAELHNHLVLYTEIDREHCSF